MKNPLKRPWTKKKIIIVLALVCLILLGLLIKSINGPAKGTIVVDKTTPHSNVASYETLAGKNFSLSYPQTYRIEDTGQHAVNILESYRLTALPARGGLTKVVAVTIYDVPTDQLTDTSAYKIRKDKPAEYSEEVREINGNQLNIMKDRLTNETVAFTKKAGKVATIAFSGGVSQVGAAEDFEHIISSWHWN